MNRALTSQPVRVIAHRGASAYAPENTLAAFALAAEMGAQWIELDCTFSRDEEVVVIHDPTLERTTSGSGPVSACTLSELRALDAGAWKEPRFAGECIPTFEEALGLVQARALGVYVEIKDRADHAALENAVLKSGRQDPLNAQALAALASSVERETPETVALVRKVLQRMAGRVPEERVVIQSFSPITCALARAFAPSLSTALLAAPATDGDWDRCVAFGRLFQLEGLNIQHTQHTADRVAAIHNIGMTTAVWTVDDPEDMARFVGWGVGNIITNRPDIALDAVRTEGPS